MLFVKWRPFCLGLSVNAADIAVTREIDVFFLILRVAKLYWYCNMRYVFTRTQLIKDIYTMLTITWHFLGFHLFRLMLKCLWSQQIFSSIYPTMCYVSLWNRWLSAKLQYLQCVNNGDTAVTCQNIELIFYNFILTTKSVHPTWPLVINTVKPLI